jgi:hypothetical protein
MRRNLDVVLMNEAAALLLAHNDFEVSARSTRTSTTSVVP